MIADSVDRPRVTVVFATRNRGKLVELRSLVADLAVDVLDLDEAGVTGEVEEDGATFHDNARKKAEAARDATGLFALADDSGLAVDALGGLPGVRSARYAADHLPGGLRPDSDITPDRANNNLLLASLARVPPPRAARFRCVLALARPGAEIRFAEGTCEGAIAEAARGSSGFGYDPLFIVAGTGRTLAELPLDEKNRVSHRGQAMARMAGILRDLLAPR